MKQIGVLLGIAAIGCGAALAQQDVFFASRPVAGAKIALAGPVVKGAPYTADGSSEMTQTLGDGTHISRQESYTIYRDGEGRIRRESGSQVWISDPVANTSYILDTKRQTARKMGLPRHIAYEKAQLDAQTAKVKADAMAGQAGPVWFASGAMTSEGGPMLMIGGPMRGGSPGKPEALGKQEMEGVEVEGTRNTVVIPPGQIGNDRPLQMVSERWESPELHVTILARHTDPMMGDSVEKLTNVRRGEPDPSLFQVPANFTMEAEK